MTEELIKSWAENTIERYTFHFVNGKELIVDAVSITFNSGKRIYQLFNQYAKRFEINFDKVLYVEIEALDEENN